MKFAIVEMKLALVNLMRNFELFPSENTPKTLVEDVEWAMDLI